MIENSFKLLRTVLCNFQFFVVDEDYPHELAVLVRNGKSASVRDEARYGATKPELRTLTLQCSTINNEYLPFNTSRSKALKIRLLASTRVYFLITGTSKSTGNSAQRFGLQLSSKDRCGERSAFRLTKDSDG